VSLYLILNPLFLFYFFFMKNFLIQKYQVTSVLPSTLKLKVAFPATDPTFEVYIDRIDEKSVICVI